jgi:hypothetical protein
MKGALEHCSDTAQAKTTHFTLETITSVESPANMVYQFLQPFFIKGSLLFQEVKFNLTNEDAAGTHASKLEDLVETLSR